MEVQIAVAKVRKYAVSESGDTVEVVERPHGGLSLIVADGQRSGKAAKAVSNLVVRKAMALLAEGVRDGAAARAAHDYLYTYRSGKVQATLNILSVDLVSRSIVISRNSHCPVLVVGPEGLQVLDTPSSPIGIYRVTKPVITELPIRPLTYVVVFTDGILSAGERYGQRFDVATLVASWAHPDRCSPSELADMILREAMRLDRQRPADDMTVAVLAVLPDGADGGIRRMSVHFPLPTGWD